MTYEYTHNGMMMWADEAIKTLSELVPDDKKGLMFDRAMNRFKYLANRVEKEPPVFHKGRCGKKYDYHTCRACGHIVELHDRFCGGCGREIDWGKAKHGPDDENIGNGNEKDA